MATGLDQKTRAIRVATFCSLMGKDCLQISLNVNFGTEEIMITSSLSALEDYFLPKRNLVYERYVFSIPVFKNLRELLMATSIG